MRYGVDISKHQKDSVCTDVINGGKAQFVIMRSSIGSEIIDSKYIRFCNDLKGAAMPSGIYVASYAKNESEARSEADFACDCVERYGELPKLPVFFDWEYFSAKYIKANFGVDVTRELLQKLTAAFCERVKERGYTPGFYANKDYCTRFYTEDFFTAHPEYLFWYARPGLSKPDKDCYIWQYASNDGALDFKYIGAIDKNLLYGEFVGELVESEVMKPLSEEPCRMYIGFASSGDITKLKTKIEGLGISTEEKDGYITTGYASRGDQCYIMQDCAALGIDCCVYKEHDDVSTQPTVKEQLVEALTKIKNLVDEL